MEVAVSLALTIIFSYLVIYVESFTMALVVRLAINGFALKT
jgi:hypothetical protein